MPLEVRHTLRGKDDWVLVAEFSLDGRWLAMASHDGLVRVWDVVGQQEALTLYRSGSGGVCEVTFSPGGK